MRSIRVLSAIAAVGTFIVLVLGKVVRETGASKSIPDWPLAYGQLVPTMTTTLVFWEWFHRLFALIVIIALVALIVCAIRQRGWLWLYCLMSLVLLLIAAAIGGLSINHSLHWSLAVLDFACAILSFASMVGLAVWSRMVDTNADNRVLGGTP